MSTVNAFLTEKFLAQLVRQPHGRALMLTQCALAEDSGESRLFDRLKERVEDAELQRMVQRHQDDEIRHAALFRECAARTGILPLPEVPVDIQAVERLDRALGRIFERPITNDRQVMEAYLLLQVLEERAVTQFPAFEKVFRPLDPVTADTFVEIARDEERHLRYCHAVSRRYAPDEATRQKTLREFRQIESSTFAEGNRAVMHFVLDQGYGAFGPLSRMVWRAIGAVAPRVMAAGYPTVYFDPRHPTALPA